jgi:hypothetical protein
MAISPDSSKTESITVRVPKELIEKTRSIVGGGNTKAVLTALRLLCGEPVPIYDSVPNTVIQEITERIEALENTVSNTVIQEITERLTALEGEVGNLKKAQDRDYDRESLSALGIGALRKLYRSIPRKQRSIDANYITKSQAIEAILDYQNKRQAEKDDR